MTINYYNGVYNYQAPGSVTTIILPLGHQWAKINTVSNPAYICMECHLNFPQYWDKEYVFLSPAKDQTHKWIVINDWRQKYYNGSICQQCGMTKAVGCGNQPRCNEDLSCDEKIIKEIIE
jgi:hypothetical protein